MTRRVEPTIESAPWLRRFAVRTPTLPPATHTNVYLAGQDRVAVIDPASPYPDEQAALDEALADTAVDLIVLTHHHIDHVSGAAHLARRLNVPVAAHVETAARLRGRIEVTRLLEEGERLAYGPAGLRTMFTPGHAPGHLCFVDVASRAVVAGDMVASEGTIIIEPDDGGDMAVYLASLERLSAEQASALLPAHGPPILDAKGKLAYYIQHRLAREQRVLDALSDTPRTVEELVPPSYPDVPPHIWPLAARSLLAHLHKLRDEGLAQLVGTRSWVARH